MLFFKNSLIIHCNLIPFPPSVSNSTDQCSISRISVSRDRTHNYEFTGCKYQNAHTDTWTAHFSVVNFSMLCLQDLRNYQYSLSVVEGLQIHMEMGHSYINIPKRSFNEVRRS